MSSTRPDNSPRDDWRTPEPAEFVVRPVQRNEVVDGDTRTLTLVLTRGSHSYLFPMTEQEAARLALATISGAFGLAVSDG